MTGLGIVSFLLVFITIVKKWCTQQWLQFRQLLRFLPMMILLAYICWTRTRYFLKDFVIIPLNPHYLLLYLSPYNFHFHFTGIILWLLIGRSKFIQTQKREHRFRRYSVVLEWLLLWSIPLGVFFLFWDNFIGKAIEWWRYISAIDATSKVAVYDKVIPLWLYLTAWSWILYLLLGILHQKKPSMHRVFVWYICYRLGIALLMIRQIYPRHLVAKWWPLWVDIKQYTCIVLAMILCRQRYLFATSIHRPTYETNPIT